VLNAVDYGNSKDIISFQVGSKSYGKGNVRHQMDVSSYIKDDRTMIPVYYVAQALEIDKTYWDQSNRVVILIKDGITIEIPVIKGRNEIFRNGQKIITDTSAEIKDIGGGLGRTMLPISFIAKAFDVTVDWDNETRSVIILPEASDNFILNNSVENHINENPDKWRKGHWGELDASFSYSNSGYNGSRSLKVSVNNYKSGDAKWYHDPVSVTPGKWYEFSNFYKSDVFTTVTIQYTLNDGSIRYDDVGSVPASPNDWSEFKTAVYIPENVKEICFMHRIRNNGYLIKDEFKLCSYSPSPLKRPLLSLTFDDGWEVNHETALPILEQYGFKATHGFATMFIDPANQEHREKIAKLIESGHDIESHSINHPLLTELSEDEIWKELKESRDFLRSNFNQPVKNFFSPYGTYDDRVLNAASLLYDSHRSTDVGFNGKDNFNPYNVRVQNILTTTTSSQVRQWINEAVESNTWLVLVYHRITDNPPANYDSYIDDFIDQMEEVNKSGITVLRYADALSEVSKQAIK